MFYKLGKVSLEVQNEKFKKKNIKIDAIFLKNKKCKVENCKELSNYTYLKDYKNICSQYFDSIDKRKEIKIDKGIILNFINDTLQIKQKQIIFGYDLIPRVK